MKNRLLTVAMAALCAIGMISCGNPAGPEEFELTKDNIDEYIVEIADYEGLTVSASLDTFTDEDIEEYAEYYYKSLAADVPGMTDDEGNPVPMTDEAISQLDSDAFKTVTEFMVFVRKTVSDYYTNCYESDIVQAAIDKISAASTFTELPKGLLEKEKAYISEQFSEIAKGYELSLEDYLAYCGTSVDDLAAEYAKQELVYFKIAKEKDLWSDDAEMTDKAVFDYILSVTEVEECED